MAISSIPREIAAKLRPLAKAILNREKKVAAVQDTWLQNGKDLIEAKSIAGHGHFFTWCLQNLSYTTRSAARLISATKVIEAVFKNDTVSDLPDITVVLRIGTATKDVAEQRRLFELARNSDKMMLRSRLNELIAAKSAKATKGRKRDVESADKARREATELLISNLGDAVAELLKLSAEAEPGRVLSPKMHEELSAALEAKTIALQHADRPQQPEGVGKPPVDLVLLTQEVEPRAAKPNIFEMGL